MPPDNRNDLLREMSRLYKRDMFASLALLCQRDVADHPNRAISWLYYGVALAYLSRYKEAASALRRACRLYPPTKRHLAYYYLGQLYEKKGAVRAMEGWYRRAIESFPSDDGCYIALGSFLHRSGRLQEAESVLRRAIRCKEGCRDEVFLHLGYTLVCLARYAEARTCFRRALAIDPKYKEAREALSDVEYVIKHRRSAEHKQR